MQDSDRSGRCAGGFPKSISCPEVRRTRAAAHNISFASIVGLIVRTIRRSSDFVLESSLRFRSLGKSGGQRYAFDEARHRIDQVGRHRPHRLKSGHKLTSRNECPLLPSGSQQQTSSKRPDQALHACTMFSTSRARCKGSRRLRKQRGWCRYLIRFWLFGAPAPLSCSVGIPGLSSPRGGPLSAVIVQVVGLKSQPVSAWASAMDSIRTVTSPAGLMLTPVSRSRAARARYGASFKAGLRI